MIRRPCLGNNRIICTRMSACVDLKTQPEPTIHQRPDTRMNTETENN